MFVNIIKSYRDVVVICDKELLGKKFEEGKFQLDIKENFYKGKEVNEEDSIQIMKKMSAEDATFNIVGEKSINSALKAGIISIKEVRRIKEIPFVMVLF